MVRESEVATEEQVLAKFVEQKASEELAVFKSQI